MKCLKTKCISKIQNPVNCQIDTPLRNLECPLRLLINIYTHGHNELNFIECLLNTYYVQSTMVGDILKKKNPLRIYTPQTYF